MIKKSNRRAARINVNAHAGIRLRTRRLSLGLSQQILGKGLGMAAQQVQKYEKGINAMNAQRLHEFAQFLEVPVAYFFEGIETAALLKQAGSSHKGASDRETIEVLKSFRQLRDYGLRKRVADLLRALSLKDL